MKLVRVVAPHFVAAFETDGKKVIRAAPILSKKFLGLSEDQARKVIAHFGWKASVVSVDAVSSMNPDLPVDR